MNGSSNPSSLGRTVLTTAGFLLIAAFFLQTEHRAHLFGILPFLFLLACPLLHLFMHSGHGGHGGRSDHTDDDTRSPGSRSHADHTAHGSSAGGTP